MPNTFQTTYPAMIKEQARYVAKALLPIVSAFAFALVGAVHPAKADEAQKSKPGVTKPANKDAMKETRTGTKTKAAKGAKTGNSIVGGEPVQGLVPWAVQLKSRIGDCSGSAINKYTVLTARHCVDGATDISVYYSTLDPNNNDHADDGPWPGSADVASKGDIAIIRLSKPKKLRSYVKVNLDYNPVPNSQGLIMGYGIHGDVSVPDEKALYQAKVSIVGREPADLFGGLAIVVSGIDGLASKGDSGGPLQVDDQVVAVASGVRHMYAYYADLNQAKDWINKAVGLTIDATSGFFVPPSKFRPGYGSATISGYATPGDTVKVQILGITSHPKTVPTDGNGAWSVNLDFSFEGEWKDVSATAVLIDKDGDELWTVTHSVDIKPLDR